MNRLFYTSVRLRVMSAWLTPVLLIGGGLGSNAEAATADPMKQAALACVRIITGGPDRQGAFAGQVSGSGVIISPTGYVLTTRQAVADAEGKIYPELWAALFEPESGSVAPHRALRLKMVAESAELNLALVKLSPREGRAAQFPFLKLAGRSEVTYGSRVTLLGYAASGGTLIAPRRAVVVDLDENAGWMMVDGEISAASAGGPVINELGELLGLQSATRHDHRVTFFGDEDYPLGAVSLGHLGLVYTTQAALEFLNRGGVTEGASLALTPPKRELQVGGEVVDKQTGAPLAGAAIGLVSARAQMPNLYISPNELIGHARSGPRGAFELNRHVRAGRYFLKVVHPQYQTLLLEVEINPARRNFTIELVRD